MKPSFGESRDDYISETDYLDGLSGIEAYRYIANAAYTIVMATLREGEEKYPDTAYRALMDKEPLENLEHAAEHLLDHIQRVKNDGTYMPRAGDDPHLEHAITRLVLEELRIRGL